MIKMSKKTNKNKTIMELKKFLSVTVNYYSRGKTSWTRKIWVPRKRFDHDDKKYRFCRRQICTDKYHFFLSPYLDALKTIYLIYRHRIIIRSSTPNYPDELISSSKKINLIDFRFILNHLEIYKKDYSFTSLIRI